ncbi:methyltransferase domain-containing protein, partial [Candidatus Woesearchaeota archaeon]|nr:methyltransferase domain-containing protein [Candidatus Woesearchaeota archaeon]
ERKDRGTIRFEVQDTTKLTYKDESYDVVTSMGVLEHLPAPKESMDEMLRVLKPGGKLIIVFPNWFCTFKIVKGLLNFRKKEYFTNTRFEMLMWLFESFYHLVQKEINPKPVFRKPNLKLNKQELDTYHIDEDMVYVAHPFEVRKYLESKGCRVISIVADTYRFSFIPTIAPYGGIVAIKGAHNE